MLSAIIRFLSFLSLTSTGMFQLAGTLKYRYGRASNSIIKEEKSEESSPDKRTAPPSPLHFRFYLLIWSKGYTGKQTFSHLLLHGWWKGRNGAICVIPDEGPFHGSHSCTNLWCDYSKFGFRHTDNSTTPSFIKVDLESDTQVTFQSFSALEQSYGKNTIMKFCVIILSREFKSS